MFAVYFCFLGNDILIANVQIKRTMFFAVSQHFVSNSVGYKYSLRLDFSLLFVRLYQKYYIK